MESTKLTSLLFISILFLSSSITPILACPSCGQPRPSPRPIPKPHRPVLNPPVTIPSIPKPPVTIPSIPKPPVTIPSIPKPPVTLPPIVKPPVTLPPVVPVLPPVSKPCPSPATPVVPATCPIDTLKLGACVDLLGGLVHVGLGDTAVNECCPVLQGLVELEAAACLCTTLKLRLLNLNIFLPLALQLLATCGKAPPPGYTCPL